MTKGLKKETMIEYNKQALIEKFKKGEITIKEFIEKDKKISELII